MNLKSVDLSGIRSLRRVRLDLPPGTTICVTGESGAGKTSVLEAILAARSAFVRGGREPEPAAFRGRSGDASVELTWALEPHEADGATEFVTTWRPGGASTELPPRLADRVSATRVHYFDAHRLGPPLPPIAVRSAEDRPPDSRAEGDRWAPSDRKYAWVERWMLARWDARAAALSDQVAAQGIALAERDASPFARAIERLCPRARAGRPVTRRGVRLAGFLRADGAEPAYAELTTSERMGVLFAAVLEAAELSSTRSLVLVDTPELGLHPSEHAAFLAALGELVGDGTIVAATSSPAILRAMPRERVIVL